MQAPCFGLVCMEFSAVFVAVAVGVSMFGFALRCATGKAGNLTQKLFSVSMIWHANFIGAHFDCTVLQYFNLDIVRHKLFGEIKASASRNL